MIARRYIVHGRVQGVGFRFWTLRMAQQRGIHGWVRNRIDGTVEVHAEADEEALAELERLLHQGPPAGSVTQVVRTPAAFAGQTGFRVGPTA